MNKKKKGEEKKEEKLKVDPWERWRRKGYTWYVVNKLNEITNSKPLLYLHTNRKYEKRMKMSGSCKVFTFEIIFLPKKICRNLQKKRFFRSQKSILF